MEVTKMKKAFLILLLIPLLLHSQEALKDVKNPGSKRAKKCGKYYEISRNLPIDLRYSVQVVDRQIFFYFPSEKIFQKLFDKKNDGIAIDVVTRDQFDCVNGNQLADSWAYKGEMLPPIFREELKNRMIITDNGYVLISMGELPSHFDPRNVECNLIVLQKKFHCDYTVFSGIDYNQWQLLEMGLYRDSIESQGSKDFTLTKTLTFEVPFEKNHHTYSPDEIKPLYDSLHLSDYYVNAIKIKAYSSVEGGAENNERLQNARASSIIQSLQAYQKPEIQFEISTAENWEQFYEDIKGSSYAHLAQLPDNEIKEELNSLHEEKAMESILAAHRKAVIALTLERRIRLDQSSDLIEVFGQAIRNDKIEDAMYVQNYVFSQIRHNKLPEDFIGKMEIPKLAEYNPLITNRVIFEYENSLGDIQEHVATFEELLKLLPNNPQVQYNLAALKIKASHSKSFTESRQEIWKLIKAINWKIDKTLVNRLKINYHILNTEYLDLKLAFRDRNKSLRHIFSNYSSLDLTDDERLYLVRFLTIYNQFKWAEKIIAQRAYEEGVDPKVIDYYLRLTIQNRKKFKSASYQTLLSTVIEKHTSTFCELFLPSSQGGYTFQLLEDEELSDLYCGNCQD